MFMQNLNKAWSAATDATRNSLKDCVHVRGGRVVRIDACKSYPRLEAFVRTFADGKVYIGVGSWNGHPGNPSDNSNVSDGSLPAPPWPNRGCVTVYGGR